MWQTKFGRCIYTSPSGYKVHQNYFYRWLTLGSDALQTVINRRAPHKPVLYYLPALTYTSKIMHGRVCLLGLGGAGVPLMLAHDHSFAHMDVVDCSQEVVDIAQSFFIPDPIKQCRLITKNAYDFVSECTDRYEHLMIDLYGADHFPIECNNEAFFQACKKIISEDGFLTINLANINEQVPIFNLIKKEFAQTLVLPIKKSANMVIIASNNSNRTNFLNQLALKRTLWVKSWGYVGEL